MTEEDQLRERFRRELQPGQCSLCRKLNGNFLLYHTATQHLADDPRDSTYLRSRFTCWCGAADSFSGIHAHLNCYNDTVELAVHLWKHADSPQAAAWLEKAMGVVK